MSLSVLVSWCVCPGVGLLGLFVALFLLFKGISTPFSIVAVPVCIPTNTVGGSLFFTPTPAFIACRLFDGGSSDQNEMISPCGLDLHFSDNE